MHGRLPPRAWGFGCFVLLVCGSAPGCGRTEARGDSRIFRFEYSVVVRDIPADASEIAVWIPIPQSDRHQTVRDLEVTAPDPYTIERERAYGNSILHLTADRPLPDSLGIRIRAVVERVAYHLLKEGGAGTDGEDAPLPRDLAPHRLVPTGGAIDSLASEVTRGAGTPLEKARAIYEYVTDSMRYDKSGTGWGRGDALYACEARAGNCSDFHSLIIGMARAADIPARFVMGFPLPESSDRGEIPGYHCWAELYIDGMGWLPVDSSEANKHPEKREAFFGGLDADRVQFTRGRDLVVGQQVPDSLNYLIYPHVELDGRAHDAVTHRVSFAGAELPDARSR